MKKNPIGFLRQADIIPEIVPISAATFWRWVNKGHFPAPVKLGENTTAWRKSEVIAWIEKQK